ncbi:MAG: VWA domain-containing protein [Bryobacterales bacterium]|nr:VWA domain-containing protein [Bryobacterales bacterium]
MKRLAATLLAGALLAQGALRILVTVAEQKTGEPVLGLEAKDFTVIEEKTERRVDACEFSRKPVDVMLLVDSSAVGEMVRPVASSLVAQLEEKEQMSVVSFDSSTEMIQDFTSSKQLLSAALSKIRYGNSPNVLDALFVALDQGFEHAVFRKVILLVTTGLEGHSRASEREVARLARRKSISIYPVYVAGSGKSMFEKLARQSGGASFQLRDFRQSGGKTPAARIFDVIRGYYTLTLPGNLGLMEKVRVEVKGREKLQVSALPLD